MIRKLLCVVAFSLALTPQAQAETLSQKIALSVTEGFMIPAYTAFAETSAQQAALWETACSGGTAAPLEDLRAAYAANSNAWSAIQHVAAGPVSLLLRRERLYHWPERRNAVARGLGAIVASEDASKLETEAFTNLSVAAQGLPALERILHDDGFTSKPFACQVGQAIARNIQSIASALAAEWQNDMLPLVTQGKAHAFYFGTMDELSSTMFTELLTGFEMIQTQKIALPMGKDLESARPKRAESWRSDRSGTIVKHKVEGLITMTRAFVTFLPEAEREAMIDQLARWKDATDALPLSIDKAVVTPEGRASIEQFVSVQEATRSQIVQMFQKELNLTLGFNRMDGD